MIMNKIIINPNNKKYYSDDFIKGFECGVSRQFEEDMKEQEPKLGRWVGVNPMVDTLMCSECGENIISEEFKSNYCPNCGCKMIELQEREEK